jgi:hypothetical protein
VERPTDDDGELADRLSRSATQRATGTD